MNEITLIRRIAEPLAIAAAALVALAGGLTLMNVRADWALTFGALICLATPVLAGVRLWTLLREDIVR
jgi:hypothetical protein